MVVVSADVAEAAGRFVRFTGHGVKPTTFGQAIALDRGQVQLTSRETFAAMFPEIAIPRLPFLGVYAIRVQSLASAETLIRREGLAARRLGGALVVPYPPELGLGAWLFVEKAADLPWRG
jgi:hypothetical protein